MSILLSVDRITKREFYYLEQDGEFILYFLDADQKRNFYPTLFTSLESVIEFYLFATKQEVVTKKVLALASVIITSRQRPRSIESAIIKALKVLAIKEGMKEGEVIFSFCKTDGSKRIARGTTSLDLIPIEKHPKGSDRKRNPLQIYFYDVQANAAKSFLASNILY